MLDLAALNVFNAEVSVLTINDSNLAIEHTLSIIKPDAGRKSLTGKINARFEESGLKIVAQRRIQLNKGQDEGVYAVHKERSFFSD